MYDTAVEIDGGARADEGCDMNTVDGATAGRGERNLLRRRRMKCDQGALAPSSCSCDCAQVWGAFFHRCESTLDNMARLTGGDSHAYEAFESLCTQSPEDNQCCRTLQMQFDVLEEQLCNSQVLARALQSQLRAAGMQPRSTQGSCDDASWPCTF